MKFEWDEEKNTKNIRKHGLDFADAWQIFDAPMLMTLDTREDYGEGRFVGIGFLKNFVVVVVYTDNIPPLEEAFFANAKLRVPKGKVPVVISVDADIIWFNAQGNEYQRLINAALRLYAEAHKGRPRWQRGINYPMHGTVACWRFLSNLKGHGVGSARRFLDGEAKFCPCSSS